MLTWMSSPISWRACKQPFTCLSTAECELVAAIIEALTMAESLEVILQQLDGGLGKIILGIDNQAAISLAKPTTNSSWRTRHLRVRASYIHEQIEDNQVIVRYVPGKDQWADLLTKSFPRQRLGELTALWGFVDRTVEVMKLAAVCTMLLCHVVQTARAQKKDPLPLDSSVELYIVILLVGIALIAVWEALWWLWDRCCSSPTSSRSARRLRGIQEAVQRELAAQIAARDSTDCLTYSEEAMDSIGHFRAGCANYNPAAMQEFLIIYYTEQAPSTEVWNSRAKKGSHGGLFHPDDHR